MTVSVRQIGEISTQVRGVTYSKQEAIGTARDGYLPVLRAGNIGKHGLTFEDLVYVPASKVSDKQLLRKNDVLIATSSGSIDVVGKAARSMQDFVGGFGAFCKVLRPNGEVDPGYFAHYFKTPQYRRKVSSLAAGANINNLRNEDLDDLEIPLPPLAEQKRIAGILDAADALRAKRREALAQLDTLLQATFLDLFGDPVTNPKGLEECVVGDVTDCIVPGRDKPKSFTGPTPWVTTDDLLPFGVTSESRKGIGLRQDEIAAVRARVIPKDSVIITCVGDLGITTIAGCEMVVNQQLHTFQCSRHVRPEFLMYCLSFQKSWMERRATQTTLPYLNKTNCNSIPITVPPIDVQDRFSNAFESINRVKTFYQSHLAELDTLFASLQSRAFRGEL